LGIWAAKPPSGQRQVIADADPQISSLPGGSFRVRANPKLARNIATTQTQPAILARIRQYALYTSYPL
jgi:hypothetical protein